MSFDEGKSQMYEHYLCINDVPTLHFFAVQYFKALHTSLGRIQRLSSIVTTYKSTA